MKFAFIIGAIFTLCCIKSFAQVTILDLLGDDKWKLIPSDSIFKIDVIKKEGIKKAYLLKTYGKRDENGKAEFIDTVSIIEFDSFGKQVRFRENDKWKSQQVYFGNDVMCERFYYAKGRQGDTGMVFYECQLMNAKNQVLEHESRVLPFFWQVADCWTGNLRDNISYKYDTLGRVSIRRDLVDGTEIRYVYNKFGVEVHRVYNGIAIGEVDFMAVYKSEESTVYATQDFQIVIRSHIKSRRLFETISITRSSRIQAPEIYEIVYEF
jgi:hypothetical protein